MAGSNIAENNNAENSDEEEQLSIIAEIQSKLRRLKRQRIALVDAAAKKCAPLEAALAAVRNDLKKDLERVDTTKDKLDAELNVRGAVLILSLCV